MAPDHADRRRLARAAAAEGWTVRETEARARVAADRDGDTIRARRGGLHPDQEEAASRLGEALSRALGTDVRVKPRGDGYTVSLAFDSLDEALEVAARLGAVETA